MRLRDLEMPPVATRFPRWRDLPVVAEIGAAPIVVALANGWRPDGIDIPAIRAELRGLGAVLLVFSEAGTWCFRPDDEMEAVRPPGDGQAPSIDAVAAMFGVTREAQGSFPLTVHVLDSAGAVRLAERQRTEDPSGPERALLLALRAAGQRLLSERAETPPPTFSRREVVIASLVSGIALSLGCHPRPHEDARSVDGAKSPAIDLHPGEVDIVLHINGADRALRVEPRVSLLDALRERLSLPGSKKGCDHGQCGACTVLIDERRVCACLVLAVAATGTAITTIEGLAKGDELHPMQEAFASFDALQCGYCTPGQIISAVALVAERRAVSDDDVREQMSGNLCRCGAYPNIVAAIQHVRSGA